MRKSFTLTTLFALVIALAFAATGWAQANSDNQPTVTTGGLKIGFVNTLEVLYGTEEGKQQVGKIEQFIGEKQKEGDVKTGELEKLKEQFASQQRTLNPDTRAEMQREIEERDRQLKRFQEDTQLDINRRRDELLGKMSEKIQGIIDEHASKNSFGAVFLRDQSQVFVSPALDITAEIIKIYNEKYPVAGAQPAATPPATPPTTSTPPAPKPPSR